MIAIIAAFKEEVAAYLKRYRFSPVDRVGDFRIYRSEKIPNVVVSEGGIGKVGSQENTKLIVERFQPDLIISAGFAGGAKIGIRSGDVFVCDELTAIDVPPVLWNRRDVLRTTDMKLFDRSIRGALEDPTQFRMSACLTAPTLVPTQVMKAWIGKTFDVNLIDMESYWVNELAWSLNIPCLVVRAVFDSVEQSLPRFIGETLTRNRLARNIRAFRHLLLNPVDVPYLIRLTSQMKVASGSLTKTIETITGSKRQLETEHGPNV